MEALTSPKAALSLHIKRAYFRWSLAAEYLNNQVELSRNRLDKRSIYQRAVKETYRSKPFKVKEDDSSWREVLHSRQTNYRSSSSREFREGS